MSTLKIIEVTPLQSVTQLHRDPNEARRRCTMTVLPPIVAPDVLTLAEHILQSKEGDFDLSHLGARLRHHFDLALVGFQSYFDSSNRAKRIRPCSWLAC
jgi:hypothetical protein